MRYASRLKLLIFIIVLGLSSYAYSFQVITSIVPLHSFACWLLKDIAEPKLLLNGSESAHTYHLKPSDIKKIYTADLILWVGPTYETFLKKAISSSHKPSLSILDAPHLNLLPLRTPCAHSHEHQSSAHSHEKCSSLMAYDPHVWLDPLRVKKILIFMHDRFLKELPHEKRRLERNLAQALDALDALHDHLQKKLNPLKNQPFMVYHDGYQYLEQAYGLKNLGPVVAYPEAPLSLHDKQQFIAYLRQYPHLCVFAESQFSPKILEDLKNHLTFKQGILDPLGINLEGIHAYDTMMKQLAINLEACLKP